jgi:hypothetical protein
MWFGNLMAGVPVLQKRRDEINKKRKQILARKKATGKFDSSQGRVGQRNSAVTALGDDGSMDGPNFNQIKFVPKGRAGRQDKKKKKIMAIDEHKRMVVRHICDINKNPYLR